FIGGAGSLAFALGSAFLSFLIIVVFMVIFLLDGNKFTHSFLHAVPGEHYGTAKGMLDKISLQIHAYIRGQLIAATSVGVTSIIGLYILQWITGISIPYTILIGIGAGLFNLIPFVGPIAGMIPALILFLVTDQTMPIHIIYVLLIIMVFAIVQLIDNLVVSPYIMGGSVGLHPILVIILVLLGASVGGILGMLFVIPIAAILKVVLGEFVTNLKK
ncbi:MAG TPA: AI-2E family transporter, partial [Candidatus Marinimicrobia bacterium]|nr:AI-2E family transporter [Candidatus Neomarinimicrobiota bacterium]